MSNRRKRTTKNPKRHPKRRAFNKPKGSFGSPPPQASSIEASVPPTPVDAAVLVKASLGSSPTQATSMRVGLNTSIDWTLLQLTTLRDFKLQLEDKMGKEPKPTPVWLQPLAQNSSETAEIEESKSANAAAAGKIRIGQNIDKLRKECGWSYAELSAQTGIDKKAILSHAHGKSKPNPQTQRKYAEAFSKELSRSITANDLEK